MAQRPNNKRMERMEKSERNMNRAVLLLVSGLVAEWYLLMVDRYYARGTVGQVLKWYNFLGAMRWVGLGVLVVGAVLWLALRGKKTWAAKAGGAVMALGAFFAFSSEVMRHAWPTSVTVMCVFVPVLMILGIVLLFYQAEFTIQACALAMALGALVLLGRSSTRTVQACAILALLGIAVLTVCSLLLRKNGGALRRGDKVVRVFGQGVDYRILFGVLALCFVLVLASLFASAVAFYGTLVLAVVAFALAVYYTIKLM